MRVTDTHHGRLGVSDQVLGFLGPFEAARDDVLRREDQMPQQRLVLDDLDVAVNARKPREPVGQRGNISDAVDGLKLAMLFQLLDKREVLDALAAFLQVGHALEDAPVLFNIEVRRIERTRDLRKQ